MQFQGYTEIKIMKVVTLKKDVVSTVESSKLAI